jgi:hypothetical protein
MSADIEADTVTSSGTSTQATPTGQPGQVWTVSVSGGNVYLKFGANPTAAADAGWLMLDGETREWGVSVADELVAVKDA